MSNVPDISRSYPDSSDMRRDAIHVAILPCRAFEDLERADYVKLIYDDEFPAVGKCDKDDMKCIGVVSPYLDKVEQDSYFYVLMNPGSVNSLRHSWSHNMLADESDYYDDDYECRGCW